MLFASNLDISESFWPRPPELTVAQRIALIQQLNPPALLQFVLHKAAMLDVAWMRTFQEAGVFRLDAGDLMLAAPGAFAGASAMAYRASNHLPRMTDSYRDFFFEHVSGLSKDWHLVSVEFMLDLGAAACVVDDSETLGALIGFLQKHKQSRLVLNIDVVTDGLINGNKSMNLALVAAHFGSPRCLQMLIDQAGPELRFVEEGYKEVGGLGRPVSLSRALQKLAIRAHPATLPLLLESIRQQQRRQQEPGVVPFGAGPDKANSNESMQALYSAAMNALGDLPDRTSSDSEYAQAVVQIYADAGVYEIDAYNVKGLDVVSNAIVRCARHGSTIVLDSMLERNVKIGWYAVGQNLNHRERTDLWIEDASFGCSDQASARVVHAAHESDGGWDAFLQGLQRPSRPSTERDLNALGPSTLDQLCFGFHAATFSALLECGLQPETLLCVDNKHEGSIPTDSVERAMQALAAKADTGSLPYAGEPTPRDMRQTVTIYRSWLAAREARLAVDSMRALIPSV